MSSGMRARVRRSSIHAGAAQCFVEGDVGFVAADQVVRLIDHRVDPRFYIGEEIA